MMVNLEDIVRKSEAFARDMADQISNVSLNLLQELVFKSTHFRNKQILNNHLTKVARCSHPLIYIIRISSSRKRKILIDYFEKYHALNKMKVKNVDRVNLSRYNRTFSEVVYVGSSTTNFLLRLKNHLGTEGTRVYSMHLSKWDGGLNYDLNISLFKVTSFATENVERFIVEIIEQQLWDELKPIFGKRSGL